MKMTRDEALKLLAEALKLDEATVDKMMRALVLDTPLVQEDESLSYKLFDAWDEDKENKYNGLL